MDKQFVMVINTNHNFIPFIFTDIRSDKRVIVLDDISKKPGKKFISTIYRIHTSLKINNVINLPFKKIWGNTLENIDWKNNIEYYIIFTTLWPLDKKYLEEKKKKFNVKYILYLIDTWNGPYIDKVKYYTDKLGIKFDYIFSFDPMDSKKYNFIYSDTHYSTTLINKKHSDIKYDLYLVASAKTRGRLPIFHAIYKELHEHNVSTLYRVNWVPKEKQKYQEGIIYNELISYPDAVEEAINSNCILEVLAKGQAGATLRYYEAVCYNKKLLTNNKNVVNLPFYNPDYIHIFEKPEDIDCDWVKERIPVDYHYDGRFSPTHLIDRIIELEEEKEGKTGGSEQAS